MQTKIDDIQARQDQIAYKESNALVKMMVNERYGSEDDSDPKRYTDVKFGKAKVPDNPGLKVHSVRLKFSGLTAQRAVVEGFVAKDKLTRIAQ